MLKRVMLAAVVGLGGLLVGSRAMAEPFQAKQVPAAAQWVLHIDADALMKSAAWPMVQERLNRNQGISQKMSEIEIATGIAIPDDFHSVTIYGMGFEEGDAVVLLQISNINQAHITQLLQMNQGFASEQYNGHDLLSWDDNGKTKYGSFFGADRVVVGDQKQNVQKAVDALDGKGEAFVSPTTQPASGSVLALLASASVEPLARKDPKNPVLKQMRSVWFTLSQSQQSVTLHGSAAAKDEKSAQQLKTMAEGLKALATMMAANENADARLKLIAPLLPGASASCEGANVLVNWTASIDELKALGEAADALHKAKQKAD